jgi:hypothetical protein
MNRVIYIFKPINEKPSTLVKALIQKRSMFHGYAFLLHTILFY